MLANDSPDIAAVGACLASETRSVCAKRYRQRIHVERFVAIEVCDGDFGGGDQVVIGALKLEEIRFELRKVAGTVETGGIDQERGKHFAIAVLARVDIEEEINQRALESGAEVPIDGESSTRDLRGTFKV